MSYRWLILIIVITGIIFPTIFICQNHKLDIYDSRIKASSLVVKENIGLPVNIQIPSIHVDAGFQYVGLTSDGAMDVPEGPLDVAWFNLGPHPGESGSAVVAGHSGWKNDIPSVFDDLSKIKIGDKVYIKDENGLSISFVVHDIKSYDPKDYIGSVFNRNDGKSHLNLITCGGTWDAEKQTHSNRIVVFTDRE